MRKPVIKNDPAKRGRGRPPSLAELERVAISVEPTLIRAAEALVPVFDKASALGVKHTRLDVLRSAIAKGLEALRAETSAT